MNFAAVIHSFTLEWSHSSTLDPQCAVVDRFKINLMVRSRGFFLNDQSDDQMTPNKMNFAIVGRSFHSLWPKITTFVTEFYVRL